MIRLINFNKELVNKQISKAKKRDALQVKQCNRIFQLASRLEREKIIDEQKQAKQKKITARKNKKKKLEQLEQNFKNEVDLVKEMIEKEKFEKGVQKIAQVEVSS